MVVRLLVGEGVGEHAVKVAPSPSPSLSGSQAAAPEFVAELVPAAASAAAVMSVAAFVVPTTGEWLPTLHLGQPAQAQLH